jgi:opacity protein-like surface antigen
MSDVQCQEGEKCENGFWNEKKYYLDIFGGANFLQTEKKDGVSPRYRPGYLISGSLGKRYGLGFRLEAEYAYRRNALKRIQFRDQSLSLHGHFQSFSYMINLLWDFPLFDLCGIRPFVGAGIGYDKEQVKVDSTKISFSRRRKEFAWQIMAGLGYPIFCNVNLYLEYKVHRGCFSHIYNHAFGGGLRCNFGF